MAAKPDRLAVYSGDAPPEKDDRIYPGDPDYDPSEKPMWTLDSNGNAKR